MHESAINLLFKELSKNDIVFSDISFLLEGITIKAVGGNGLIELCYLSQVCFSHLEKNLFCGKISVVNPYTRRSFDGVSFYFKDLSTKEILLLVIEKSSLEYSKFVNSISETLASLEQIKVLVKSDAFNDKPEDENNIETIFYQISKLEEREYASIIAVFNHNKEKFKNYELAKVFLDKVKDKIININNSKKREQTSLQTSYGRIRQYQNSDILNSIFEHLNQDLVKKFIIENSDHIIFTKKISSLFSEDELKNLWFAGVESKVPKADLKKVTNLYYSTSVGIKALPNLKNLFMISVGKNFLTPKGINIFCFYTKDIKTAEYLANLGKNVRTSNSNIHKLTVDGVSSTFLWTER